eukprot:gb/GECH01011005.1/.p1 GENE.gb/GECH01011005.1/~~gb/GECH01011005.1/.p1  ORF type:complete len:1529 (+),score=302.76 gb/GECH01011005.1/:1-4587(+)
MKRVLSMNKLSLVLVVFTLSILLVFSFAAEQNTNDMRNLLAHGESSKIIDLLDKILLKLKNELEGKQHTKDKSAQEIINQIDAANERKTTLEDRLSVATERLEVLRKKKESMESSKFVGGTRDPSIIRNEIDLVHKIKKKLVGNSVVETCQTASDCGEEMECDKGKCRVPLEGDCVSSYECTSLARCINGKCNSVIDESCQVDDDCTADSVCHKSKCKINVGEPCQQDEQCFTSVCQEGSCKMPSEGMCSSSSDCGEGLICNDHRCLLKNGEECSTNNECAAQYCAQESEKKVCTNSPCSGVTCVPTQHCIDQVGAYGNHTETFENGLGPEWEVNNFYIQGRSYSGSKGAGSTHDGKIDARYFPEKLRGGRRIKQFSFYWWETSSQSGFYVAPRDNRGNALFAAEGENPQWEVDDATGHTQIHGGDGYQRWTYYQFDIDWANNEYSYLMKDTNTKTVRTGTRRMYANVGNVESFEFGGEYTGDHGGSADDMVFDDFSFGVDPEEVCQAMMACDPSSEECRLEPGGFCASSSECIGDLICQDGKCMAELNEQCETSSHCLSGLCYNGRCKLPSGGDSKCNSNDQCAYGKCDLQGETCLMSTPSKFQNNLVLGDFRISDDKKTIWTTGSGRGSALIEPSNNQGRWYYEVKCNDKDNNCQGAVFGISEQGHDSGVSGKHYGFRPDYGRIETNHGNDNYGNNTIKHGDVFGVDVNLDFNSIRFSRNGRNYDYYYISSGRYFPAIWDDWTDSSWNMNLTINTGFDSFEYSPPANSHYGWFGGFIGSQCFSDSQCTDGLICYDTECKIPIGERCADDDYCETSLCISNTCLHHLGENCQENAECSSGRCINRLCSVGSTAQFNVRSQMGNMELSESRTRVSFAPNEHWRGTVLGDVGNEAGKWYYEVECVDSCYSINIGIASQSGSSNPGGRYVGWEPYEGRIRSSQGSYSYGGSRRFSKGDVIGVHVDLDNNRMGFTDNGAFRNWTQKIPSGLYYPAVWDNNNDRTSDVRVNFGHYEFQYQGDQNYHSGWFGGVILSTCASNVECEGDLVCHDGRCRYPLKHDCTSDKECSTPWCFNNKCLLKAGEHCGYGDECATEVCAHGRCSTKQFTTFDPTTTSDEVSLSNGFTEVDMDRRGSVFGNMANVQSKWYYEVECIADTCHRLAAGISSDSGDYYALSFDYRCESNHGNKGFNVPKVNDGDIIGVSVDLDDNKISFYHNGTWLGPCYEDIKPNQKYYPYIYDSDNDQHTAAIANFGYYPFQHSVPVGHRGGWYGGIILSSCDSNNQYSVHGCGEDLVCFEGSCRLPAEYPCSRSEECSTAKCYDNKCKQMAGDKCEAHTECATGSCIDKRCQTGDYAVWDPRSIVSDLRVEDLAKTMIYSSNNARGTVLGTLGKTSGKYYYEVECLDRCRSLEVGVASATGENRPSGKYMGYRPWNTYMYASNNGRNYGSNDGDADGDVLGVYVDLDNRRLAITHKGEFIGWNTQNLEDLSNGEQYYPAVWDNDGNDSFHIRTNFGYYSWQNEVKEEFQGGWK